MTRQSLYLKNYNLATRQNKFNNIWIERIEHKLNVALIILVISENIHSLRLAGPKQNKQKCIKRNDQFLNIHNRTICNEWRANVDMQIILDQSAARHYMVKYITNGEKAGQQLTNLLKDVCNNLKEEDNPQT